MPDRHPARPPAAERLRERLRLAGASERITQAFADEQVDLLYGDLVQFADGR
jgi:hypothetical protein